MIKKLFLKAYFSSNYNLFFRWLAQVEDAPEENYWVVGKLLEKMTEEGKLVEGELDGPHWEDQWWIGAKSYVRNIL